MDVVNASVNLVDMETPDPAQFFEELAHNEITLFPASVLVGSLLYGKQLVMSKLYEIRNLVFAVPVLSRQPNWSFQSNSFLRFLCIVAIILIFKLAISILKSKFADWSLFDLIQLLLGAGWNRQLVNKPQKIVFILIILISMTFLCDLLSDLVNIHLGQKVIPLDTVNQISQSGIFTRIKFTAYQSMKIWRN